MNEEIEIQKILDKYKMQIDDGTFYVKEHRYLFGKNIKVNLNIDAEYVNSMEHSERVSYIHRIKKEKEKIEKDISINRAILNKRLGILSQNISSLDKELDELNITNMPYNDTFNNLYLLYCLNPKGYPTGKKVLKKYNYKYLITDMLGKIRNKIYDDKPLEPNELHLLKFQINNDIVNEADIKLYQKYVFNNVINKSGTIDYDTFRHTFICYASEKIKMYNPDANLRISTLQEINDEFAEDKEYKSKSQDSWEEGGNVGGYATINEITLPEEDLVSFYNNCDISLFSSFFHELKHIEQYGIYYNNNIKGINRSLSGLKDHILTSYVENYYLDNYHAISFEADAYLAGDLKSNDFLNAFGYSIKPELLLPFLEYQDKKLENNTRFVNNQKQKLDKAFDEFISDKPYIVQEFPLLTIEYKIKEDKVKRKTYNELKNGLRKVNSYAYTYEEKEELKQAYYNLLQKKKIERLEKKVKVLTKKIKTKK